MEFHWFFNEMGFRWPTPRGCKFAKFPLVFQRNAVQVAFLLTWRDRRVSDTLRIDSEARWPFFGFPMAFSIIPSDIRGTDSPRDTTGGAIHSVEKIDWFYVLPAVRLQRSTNASFDY